MSLQLQTTEKKTKPVKVLRLCLLWGALNVFLLFGVIFRVPLCLSFESITKDSIHNFFATSSNYMKGIVHTLYEFTSILDQHQELLTLRSQNKELLMRVSELERFAEENKTLSALLSKTKRSRPYQALSKVILFSSHPYLRSLLIEAGGNKFIPGQAVTSEDSLIGQIMEVQDNFATVRLINDTHSHIPVRVGQAQGVLTGSSLGKLTVTMVDQMDSIPIDSPATTLSDGVHLPSDMLVGYVESVTNDSITLRPATHLRPKFVMVLPKISKK